MSPQLGLPPASNHCYAERSCGVPGHPFKQ